MPVTLPPEVWSRVIFFVAPPLPFVGLEDESFAEDALEWRRDGTRKGAWKDVDALMLVSKTFNELAAPFFWSYVVLKSFPGLTGVLDWCTPLIVQRKTEDPRLNYIKVLHVEDQGQSGVPFLQHCKILIDVLPRVVHLHFDSYPSITGLVLGSENTFDAAVMLVRFAPSLRRLAIYTLDDDDDSALALKAKTPKKLLFVFPRLAQLVTGTWTDNEPAWLEDLILQNWQLPALCKLAIGPPDARGLAYDDDSRCIRGANASALTRLYLTDLSVVPKEFGRLAEAGVHELAFGHKSGYVDAENVACMDLDEFRLELDDVAAGGVCKTVKLVTVVEGSHVRWAGDGFDVCLAELVNQRHFPALGKVVWVAREDPEDADKSSDENNGWSRHLVQWVVRLVKGGVEFEMR